VTLETVAVDAIVNGLTELYLGGLDARTRVILDAASVVRRRDAGERRCNHDGYRPRRLGGSDGGLGCT
jgi:hypothetical protein